MSLQPYSVVSNARAETTSVLAGITNNETTERAPKRPLAAYDYFFLDECKKLAKAEASDNHGPAKRRKGNAEPKVPLEDMGKIIGSRWRRIGKEDESKYYEMEDRDAERYQNEIEQLCKDQVKQMYTDHALIMSAQRTDKKSICSPDSQEQQIIVKSEWNVFKEMIIGRRNELLSVASALRDIEASKADRGIHASTNRFNAQMMQRANNLNIGPGASSSPVKWSSLGASTTCSETSDQDDSVVSNNSLAQTDFVEAAVDHFTSRRQSSNGSLSDWWKESSKSEISSIWTTEAKDTASQKDLACCAEELHKSAVFFQTA